MSVIPFKKPASMTLKEITDLLEVEHNKAMKTVEKMAKSKGFGSVAKIATQYQSGKGRLSMIQTYQLNRRQSMAVAARLNTALLMKVIDRLDELENTPQLPTQVQAIEHMLFLAKEVETQKAIAQHAIKTKHEIGSRREATAMATASTQTRRANKLEIELDQSKQYASIKRMQMVHKGSSFDWRKLKTASKAVKKKPIDVFDHNYGSIKAYHFEAWQAAYSLEVQS